MSKGSSESTQTPTVAPRNVPRQTALDQQQFEIPLEDAGAAEPAIAAEPTKRRVGGGGGAWDSCSGDIPGAGAVMVQYNVQIRNCYERALKSNGVLQGSLNLRLRIGANGAVDGTQVGGSLGDRDVFSCVRAVADRIRFPQVRGGSCAVLAVPFSFTPRS